MQTLHDVLVGVVLLQIGGVAALFIHVEGIGILHNELTRTDQTEAWTRLITELRLQLIQREGHVLVGLDLHLGGLGEQFLVRRTKDIALLLTVLQREHTVTKACPAARSYVDVFRNEGRHQQFLTVGAVHFFAKDFLNVLHDLPSQRQHHVDAGGTLLDVAGTYEKVGRDGIFVLRILFQRIEITVFQSHKNSPFSARNKYSMIVARFFTLLWFDFRMMRN